MVFTQVKLMTPISISVLKKLKEGLHMGEKSEGPGWQQQYIPYTCIFMSRK